MDWIDEEFEKLKEKPTVPKQVIGMFGLEYECPWCGETDGIRVLMKMCPWCGQKFTWVVKGGTEWQLVYKNQFQNF